MLFSLMGQIPEWGVTRMHQMPEKLHAQGPFARMDYCPNIFFFKYLWIKTYTHTFKENETLFVGFF